MDSHRIQKAGITRRGVLAGAAMLGIGAGLDHLLTAPESANRDRTADELRGAAVPFFGTHQAGIDTRAPEFWAGFVLYGEPTRLKL